MSAEPEIDLTASPAEVFEAITALDADSFDALMEDPGRRPAVIDALVSHLAGQFRPEKAEGIEAVLHVKLWDRPEGGYDHRELVISDGSCRASSSPERDPDLTLKVRPSDLRKLVTGEAGARRMAFRGRLRVLGDLGLAMRLSDLFDLSGSGPE